LRKYLELEHVVAANTLQTDCELPATITDVYSSLPITTLLQTIRGTERPAPIADVYLSLSSQLFQTQTLRTIPDIGVVSDWDISPKAHLLIQCPEIGVI